MLAACGHQTAESETERELEKMDTEREREREREREADRQTQRRDPVFDMSMERHSSALVTDANDVVVRYPVQEVGPVWG